MWSGSNEPKFWTSVTFQRPGVDIIERKNNDTFAENQTCKVKL